MNQGIIFVDGYRYRAELKALEMRAMVQGLTILIYVKCDAADAAALALCHLAVAPMHQKLIAAGAESIHGRARSRKSA